MRPFLLIFSLNTVLLFSETTIAQPNLIKPRIIITADPELDDNNSLIRFLLYSTDFQVEGLIYASSQFHWKGDGKGTKFMVPGREYTRYGLNLCPCESYRWKKDERFIHEAVEAYEKVYPNLKIHNSLYPEPAYLKSKIKYGNINFEGDISEDSEGSNLIKSVILDHVPGPLFITAWGGPSTIARALKSIEDEYIQTKDWPSIKKKISEKVILLLSGEQDNSYKTYIKSNWPDIDYRQYRDGPNYGYGAQLVASPENARFLTAEWMKENVTSKGPLGEIYRVWGDGKQMVKGDRFDYFGIDGYNNEQLKEMGYIVWMPVQTKGSWLGEGDTGTFMNLLSNGLFAFDKDSPGGWSGRPFHPDPEKYIDPFSNDTSKVKDLVISDSSLKKMNASENTIAFPNFFPAVQNDFATRMDWSVKSDFQLANHAPLIDLKLNDIYTKPGAHLTIHAKVKDPDGNRFSVRWWQFLKDQNTSNLSISAEQNLKTKIEIPRDAKENQILYLVLEVTDDATKSLTSYQTIRIHL